jgi:hypothetical protein
MTANALPAGRPTMKGTIGAKILRSAAVAEPIVLCETANTFSLKFALLQPHAHVSTIGAQCSLLVASSRLSTVWTFSLDFQALIK